MKMFVLMLCLLFSGKAMAETTIVTKFNPGSQPYIILQLLVKSVKERTGQNFTVSHIGGARGEAAGQFAANSARAGRKIIVFTGLSSLSLNVLTIPEAKNNLTDFSIISAVGSVDMGVFPADRYKNMDLMTFVNELKKSQKPIFFGTLDRSSIQVFIAQLFSNVTQTPKPRTLNYKTYGELLLSLKNNEIDYSLAPLLTFADRQPLIVSNGPKELPDFNFEGFLLLKIPNQFASDVSELSSIFGKTCDDKELTKNMNSFGYRHQCESGDIVREIAMKQKSQIEKFINETN
jgi:hypothetical protein